MKHQLASSRPLALLAAARPAACAAPAAAARALSRGRHRAVWHLIIDDKHVTYHRRRASSRSCSRGRRSIIGIAGEIYQTPRINVNIVHARCNAGERRTYPDKVQVTVDGCSATAAAGCRAVAGSLPLALRVPRCRSPPCQLRHRGACRDQWQPTPAAAIIDALRRRRLGARFGCNRSAAIRSLAARSRPPSRQTLMGCPNPRTFESKAARSSPADAVLDRRPCRCNAAARSCSSRALAYSAAICGGRRCRRRILVSGRGLASTIGSCGNVLGAAGAQVLEPARLGEHLAFEAADHLVVGVVGASRGCVPTEAICSAIVASRECSSLAELGDLCRRFAASFSCRQTLATVRAMATRLVGVASSTRRSNAQSQSVGSCSSAAVRKCSPGMYMTT